MLKTKTSWSKTKTFIFVLEVPRDQDPGLEDYITGIQMEYDILHHWHVWRPYSSEIKGFNVTLSVWRVCPPLNKEESEAAKLAGRLSVSWRTFCTSSKARRAKLKLPLNTMAENHPYLCNRKAYELCTWMEYDPHHRRARWPQRPEVKVITLCRHFDAFAHNSRKVAEAAKLAGRLSVPHLIFCTSSKVKGHQATGCHSSHQLQVVGHTAAVPLQDALLVTRLECVSWLRVFQSSWEYLNEQSIAVVNTTTLAHFC